jgi:coenzyme F420-reducing hydrogenase gamma subunit
VGIVYAHPEYVSSLSTSTPISAHVPVDFELNGCPIDRHQLLEVITASLVGRRPVIPDHTVCQQCKGRGTVCVLVAHGTPCLGPVTRAGCGALCPSIGRGCYGCFGPVGGANTGALAEELLSQGMAPVDASRLFSTFYSGNDVFGRQSVTLRSRAGSTPEEAP